MAKETYGIQIINIGGNVFNSNLNQKINADNEYISINMDLNDIDTLTILLLEFIKKTHLITLIYNKNIYNFQTNVLNSNNKEEIKPNIIGIRFTAKIMGLELLS
ncbi:MAG TPA: hypothetical protein VKA95_16140 [Nitrososphaeraceae archaeon]|nr:hypothetical protein [Nitrososphaeraceae archaeon]